MMRGPFLFSFVERLPRLCRFPYRVMPRSPMGNTVENNYLANNFTHSLPPRLVLPLGNVP